MRSALAKRIYNLILINNWLLTCQYWDVAKTYTPPSAWAVSLFSPFSRAASLARLHIGGGQAGGIGWGKEVAEALLGQVPVFVVVEGLSWELAEEVGTVPEAAGATVLIQRPVGGCQRLCAAAAANTAGDGTNKDSFQHYCHVLRQTSNIVDVWHAKLWHTAMSVDVCIPYCQHIP